MTADLPYETQYYGVTLRYRGMKNIALLIFTFISYLFLASCDHRDDPTPDIAGTPVSRTVLVYMVANNSLSPNVYSDIAEMQEAADNGALDKKGRLLVFLSSASSQQLLEIRKNESPKVLHSFDDVEGVRPSPLDTTFMRSVFDKMRESSPSEKYGLVLWSHGTGWMDESTASRSTMLYSFGADKVNSVTEKMTVRSLSRALNGQGFEWIYFDCCHMMTVEVLYELRDCARYFVGSTTELPSDGMPYQQNIPCFFEEESNLTQAAENTYKYYARYSMPCSMTVVDGELLPELADATRDIFAAQPTLPDDYYGIQLMRREVSIICTIYDMPDYIKALSPAPDALERWEAVYDQAIMYYACTPTVFGLKMDGTYGIGSHILYSWSDPTQFNYNLTSWYKDVIAPESN